jgi:hypothetical protein
MLIDLRRDRVRTLRARGDARDPLALRRAMERGLAAASLRPRGLPSRAIVCVRRLQVAVRSADGDRWAATLDRLVEDLLPGIARPLTDAVPAGAQAVVFLDEAELLACMARDWRRGAGDAWWWRSLLGGPAGAATVERAFLKAPTCVPAALELLSAAGQATEVLGGFTASYCERLADAVAASFAVPRWRRDGADAVAADVPAGSARRQRSRRATEAYDEPVASVWAGPLELDAGRVSSAAHYALLGLALALRRAPALARAPGFVAWLRRTWNTTGREAAATPPPVEARARPGTRPDGSSCTTPAPHADAGPDDRPRTDRDVAGPPRSRTEGHLPTADVPAADAPRADILTAEPLSTLAPPSAQAMAPPRVARGRAPVPALAHRHVESEFAGVLYLVNLALYLGLYADFTQPARRGLALPLGDFLALIGQRACGSAFRADPVWDVLAELAGREPTQPPGSAVVHSRRRRRRGRSAARFARWLTHLATLLESRAALALGVERDAALPFLCARPGRLELTATRLDATFTLADHPLSIRIAGLDRNPGWVPAAGRVIELHYD